MRNQKHLLVLDPIAFAGGSKIATENILRNLNRRKVRVTVVTRDADSWHLDGVTRSKLYELNKLVGKEQGIGYFLRYFMIVFSLFWARAKYGRFDIALGASGPGVDLALYLSKPMFGFDIVQLVHGPVARSRTIGRCLRDANAVFYLDSMGDSVRNALQTVMPEGEAASLMCRSNYQTMTNGLPESSWPTRSFIRTPKLFWAASLLKWKGLDLFVGALRLMSEEKCPETNICYIRPKETNLAVSEAEIPMETVRWHESPGYLDSIRASSSIFVSTSKNEPFGLSILESMAAGLCVVIPGDGAYWDKVLKDGINCIKYRPDDEVDLCHKLQDAVSNMQKTLAIAENGREMAELYRSEKVYEPIVRRLQSPINNSIPFVGAHQVQGE